MHKKKNNSFFFIEMLALQKNENVCYFRLQLCGLLCNQILLSWTSRPRSSPGERTSLKDLTVCLTHFFQNFVTWETKSCVQSSRSNSKFRIFFTKIEWCMTTWASIWVAIAAVQANIITTTVKDTSKNTFLDETLVVKLSSCQSSFFHGEN